ncbi:MAG TPA: hypothetical protein P5277_04425 [Candidatus Paceibacterota bacterium]|nr:hypothetical protein [Candidatus Paceibacterota bacterium]
MKKSIKIIIITIVVISLLLLVGFIIMNNQFAYNNSIISIKIGNETIATNINIISLGEIKIAYCNTNQDSYECFFEGVVKVTPKVSKKFAEITSQLEVDYQNPSYFDSKGNPVFILTEPQLYDSEGKPVYITPQVDYSKYKKEFHLSEALHFYLDNEPLSSQFIPENMKNTEQSSFIFFGSSVAKTRDEAINLIQVKVDRLKHIHIGEV